MKWIGQHIWNLISRFRSDVYLESLSESAQDHVIGVDANGKLYKQDVSSGDITGVDLTATTGIDITSETNTTGGDYSATIGVDVSDFMTNGSDNRVLTATGADAMNAEANLTFDGSTLTVTGDLSITGDITSVGDDVSVGDNILLTSASGVIQFTGTAGGGGEGVQYKDAGGSNRYGLLFPGSDVVAIANRASNGTVEIRANTSTAGSGGEVTQVTVADDKVHIAGTLELGHGSDTTIARSSAGVVTIEGNTIVTGGSGGSNLIMLSSGNGYLSTITADEWYFGNNSYGHSYHNWNNVKAAITADEGTFTMSEDYNLVGRLVPEALSKVKLQISARPSGGSSTGEILSACIVSADRDGAGTNTTWTVLAQGTITQVQGEYDGVDITYTGSIPTSKMLAIGVGSTESGSIGTTNVRFNYALTGYIT